MKFGTLLAVLTFCIGAAFTLFDIGTDASLAYVYWNGSYEVHGLSTINGIGSHINSLFAYPTTIWIVLGGLSQFILIAYYLHRGDNRLSWLPKSIRYLLLPCSAILLGPVIVNLYGAFYDLSYADKSSFNDDILRLVILTFLS